MIKDRAYRQDVLELEKAAHELSNGICTTENAFRSLTETFNREIHEVGIHAEEIERIVRLMDRARQETDRADRVLKVALQNMMGENDGGSPQP